MDFFFKTKGRDDGFERHIADRVKAKADSLVKSKEPPKRKKVVYKNKYKVVMEGGKTYYNTPENRQAVRNGDLDGNKVIYKGKSIDFKEFRKINKK